MLGRIRERWYWPGAVSLGFAFAAVAVVDARFLAEGGLAPLAVAGVVAAFLGVPVATLEWRAPRDDGEPWLRGVRATTDLWSLLLIGAIAAPWLREAPAGAPLIAVALWAIAALMVHFAGTLALPLLAGVIGLGAVAAAGTGAATAPPWTLLAPWWASWSSWLPAAVALGFLLPAAGWGQWSAVPEGAPGRRRVPWIVAGLALTVATALAVRHAAWFEATAGTGGPDPVAVAVGAGATFAAAGAILARDRLRPRVGWYAAAGAVATLWFAGPAWTALDVWWGTLFPLGPALWAGLLAARHQGVDRAVAGVAAAALVGAAAAGWPGLPSEEAGAAAIAATVVAAVWVAGTRALLARRPA